MTARAAADSSAHTSADTSADTSAGRNALTAARAAAGPCVHAARRGAGRARWQASSYSNAEGGNCVEVARGGGAGGVVPVRDSKCPCGTVLFFEAGAWTAFVRTLKGRGRPCGALVGGQARRPGVRRAE
ncbi:DUF397 domain-containing protein [Streptomyces sp. WMMB 322]|uniref:DUF397 domain-containing protein n=1 Tax=Streptomyces sp. WMMB 322 TaxID=1286821 RepID=UPI000823CA31|nr:DUF397 domain-containing protein [Streptomyces sp. WMMB 322]SCK26338.1 protein of unknown function [Streptomyces sp. WMMB 322]